MFLSRSLLYTHSFLHQYFIITSLFPQQGQSLNPYDTGTGRYQRAVSFWNDIAYRSEDRALLRPGGQEERKKNDNPLVGKGKRSFQEVAKGKEDDNKGTKSVLTCYYCHQPGHIRPQCPERAAKRIKIPEAKPGNKGKADKKQKGMFACVSFLSSPQGKCRDTSVDSDADDLSFDHFYQIDSAEQAVLA